MEKLQQLLDENLQTGSDMAWYWRLTIVLGVIVAAYVVDFLFVKAIIPTLRKITAKTDTEIDDILLSEKVVRSFSHIIPPIILTFGLPFVTQGTLEMIISRLTNIYIIINVTRFLCILIDALFQAVILRSKEKGKEETRLHSMKGLVQTVQIFVGVIAVILAVSILLDKSPAVLLTGLGAAAAVLMLVFQDSIKGLVAGFQLMFNDMLEVGDWITMPSKNLDGVVLEIGLTTVKVRNWDNTIMTIPPSTLVSDTFQNWKGMKESDGRRLTRTIHIDMHTVKFAEGDKTNLELYRARLYDYLKNNPKINNEMTLMVRQLPAGSEGIPVQIYGFTKTKVWEEYEEAQACIVEYAICLLKEFDLCPYQRSSDFR